MALSTLVMLGENFYGPRALYPALQAGAGDYVMPDLMRIGGVTGWLRAAALAGAAGIQMSSHLYPEVSAHLLRVDRRRPPRKGSRGTFHGAPPRRPRDPGQHHQPSHDRGRPRPPRRRGRGLRRAPSGRRVGRGHDRRLIARA